MYKNVAVCHTVSQQIRDFIEPFMFFEATQQGTRSYFISSQIARHTQKVKSCYNPLRLGTVLSSSLQV